MNQVLTLFLLFFYLLGYGQMGPCSIDGGLIDHELYFRVDNVPDAFDLGEPGEDKLWTTNFKSPRTNTYKYVKATEGQYSRYFPQADMVLRTPSGKEFYYVNVDGKIWYEMGFASLAKNSLEPSVRLYSVPINVCTPEKYAVDKKYQTSYDDDGVGLTVAYADVKDATGVLYLQDGYYDAYRIKREKTVISSEAPLIMTSYIFVDQITNEFLMEAFVDDDDIPTKVIYKAKEQSRTRVNTMEKNNFLLYPNTGYGEVRLDFSLFTPGKYEMHLFDLVGRRLWTNSYHIDGDVTIKEDLSFLPRGTYTYTIVDSEQNKIVTRRLAIIKS